MTKPIIAINCDIKRNEEVCADYLSTYTAYPDSVEKAGGIPLLIPPLADDSDLDKVLAAVDGLVLTGGDDINPDMFGQAMHEKSTLMFPRRQDFDFRLLTMALEMKIPILAVCGGLQQINIALGGSLHQHIADAYGEQIIHIRGKELSRRGEERYHGVRLAPDSLIAGIIGKETIEANSIHHQAVDRLGEGLKAVGHSVDGVIEALEFIDKTDRGLLIAIQWHPEHLSDRPEHLALFESLVGAAVEYREGGEL